MLRSMPPRAHDPSRPTLPGHDCAVVAACDMAVPALVALAALVFSPRYMAAFGDTKFPLVALGAAGLALVPAVLMLHGGPATLPRRRGVVALVAALLFAAWAAVTQRWAVNSVEGAKWTAFLVGCTGLFTACVLRAPGEAMRLLRRLVWVVAGVTLVAGGFGLAQRFGISAMELAGASAEREKYEGKFVTSTFGNGVFCAQYMAVASPLLLCAAFAWRGWRRVALLTAAVAGLGCLLATQGRAGALASVVALAAAAAGACLAAIRRADRRGLIRLATGGVLFVVVFGSAASYFGLTSRLRLEPGSSQQVSTTYRMFLYRDTLDLAVMKPWTGHGYGNFDVVIPLVQSRELLDAQRNVYGSERVNRAHNEWLDTLAETGAVGLALLLVVAFGVGRAAFGLLPRDPLRMGVGSAIVSVGVLTVFDFPLHTPATAALAWPLMGLGLALAPGADVLIRGARAVPGAVAGGGWPRRLAVGVLAVCLATAAAWPWYRNLVSQAWVRLAWEAGESARPDLALGHLRGALQASPGNRVALEMLASTLRKAELDAQAEVAIRRWQQFDPNLSTVHNMLGSVVGNQGRWDEAMHHFGTALELAPNNAPAWLNVGLVYASRGEKTAAFDALWKAFRLDAETVRPAYVKLMESARDTGHNEEGLTVAEWYLNAPGRHPGVDKDVWFIRRQLRLAQRRALASVQVSDAITTSIAAHGGGGTTATVAAGAVTTGSVAD